jgi:hypothetical protein
MNKELNYRMTQLSQAEYVRQAQEDQRVMDASRAGAVPSGRIRRLLSTDRCPPVAVRPAASLRAPEPMACDG